MISGRAKSLPKNASESPTRLISWQPLRDSRFATSVSLGAEANYQSNRSGRVESVQMARAAAAGS